MAPASATLVSSKTVKNGMETLRKNMRIFGLKKVMQIIGLKKEFYGNHHLVIFRNGRTSSTKMVGNL